MAPSFARARDFVYSNGALWERSLFGYLIEGRSLDHRHQCLLAHRNLDGGWSDEHGLPQRFPWVTACNLMALRNHGRLTVPLSE